MHGSDDTMRQTTSPAAAGAVRSGEPPPVSIVIPLYNREDLIKRAIDSCLAQTFQDFEIVVVDDGSTDRSQDRVREYDDPRIRLIVHPVNRGVCPTRNTGAEAARGEWVLLLDSDDELLPNAMATVVRETRAVAASVGRLLFRCQLDDGTISPTLEHHAGLLDYGGYLRYIESCTGGCRESLHCVRRSCFQQVRFPDNYGLEDLYHLDFSRMFLSMRCEGVLRLYHQDATNSLVNRTKVFDRARDERFVRERAENVDVALRGHRRALLAHAPSWLAEFESRQLTLWLLCGERVKAARAFWRLTRYPAELPRHTIIFAAGVLEPRLLEALRSGTRGIRNRRVAKPVPA